MKLMKHIALRGNASFLALSMVFLATVVTSLPADSLMELLLACGIVVGGWVLGYISGAPSGTATVWRIRSGVGSYLTDNEAVANRCASDVIAEYTESR